MKNRLIIILIPILISATLAAQHSPSHENHVPLPTLEVTDTSLELGAQLNPFANSFTKRIKYINVSRLKSGSVAAKAGLQNGDRITAINGIRLSEHTMSNFPRVNVRSTNNQVKLKFTVKRRNISEALEIILIFDNFSGSFDWDLGKSTLMRTWLKSDDWHEDRETNRKSQ